MRLAGLLHCAECHRERFNSLRRRDQLPFSTDDAEVVGWQTFTLADAFELRLMLDFTEQDGIGNDLARYAVIEGVGRLSMHPLNYPRTHGDMWAAVALIELPEAEAEALGIEGRSWRFAVAGRLEDLPHIVTARIDRDFHGAQLVRLVTANASRAADSVRTRARELGLPESDDFSPVWERWSWPDWVQMPEGDQ